MISDADIKELNPQESSTTTSSAHVTSGILIPKTIRVKKIQPRSIGKNLLKNGQRVLIAYISNFVALVVLAITVSMWLDLVRRMVLKRPLHENFAYQINF